MNIPKKLQRTQLVKYAFIARYKHNWPVDLMCKVMYVHRNGYYQHVKRQEQIDHRYHLELLDVVRDITRDRGYRYGSRRMKKALTDSLAL